MAGAGNITLVHLWLLFLNICEVVTGSTVLDYYFVDDVSLDKLAYHKLLPLHYITHNTIYYKLYDLSTIIYSLHDLCSFKWFVTHKLGGSHVRCFFHRPQANATVTRGVGK
jgi:hypothetical protein